MRWRKVCLGVSFVLCAASIGSLYWPGPNYGIDFQGGTELQLEFKKAIAADRLRKVLEHRGYVRPDVVNVAGSRSEYIVRVEDTNSLSKRVEEGIRQALETQIPGTALEMMDVSPGGDKLSLKFSTTVDVGQVAQVLGSAGARVREVNGAPAINAFGKPLDHRYEAHLRGVSDKVIEDLSAALGASGPKEPKRVEWVGPKAGAQLRDAAVKSFLYAIAFIMLYVALRFDLRFAPGGIIALMHDATITVGAYVALQKEVNLTLVAAVLTIVGYSINDTIVIYDRIRENMSRLRDKSLNDLINISLSQTLSRTILTSGATLLSVLAFFVWGTDVIRDIAFALTVGMIAGVYSTVYIASPITEWMDRKIFSRRASRQPAAAA